MTRISLQRSTTMASLSEHHVTLHWYVAALYDLTELTGGMLFCISNSVSILHNTSLLNKSQALLNFIEQLRYNGSIKVPNLPCRAIHILCCCHFIYSTILGIQFGTFAVNMASCTTDLYTFKYKLHLSYIKSQVCKKERKTMLTQPLVSMLEVLKKKKNSSKTTIKYDFLFHNTRQYSL